MRKKLLARLFYRDLIRDRFFLFFFVLNLSISLTGLVGLENFKAAFSNSISRRAKEIAGSDLSVSGRRALPDEKLSILLKELKPLAYSRKVSFFSMGRSAVNSKLVRVKEFDKNFPYYGSRNYYPETSSLKHDEVILYSSTLKIFDLKVGDEIIIGSKTFKVASEVLADSSETFDMGQIAPKVLISKEGIEWGEFLSKGSTSFHSIYFKTRASINEKDKNKIIDLIDDNSIRVRTMDDTSGQVGRVLQYLSDFLGIVSIVALLLSLVGGFYLYLSFILKKRKSISIYKSVGLSLRQIKNGLFFQCLIVAFMSFCLSLLGSYLINKIGSYLIAPYLSQSLDIGLSLNGVIIAIIVLIIVFVVLLKPLIGSVLNQKASSLFQESLSLDIFKNSFNYLTHVQLVSILFFLTFWLSGSWKLSLGFIAALLLGVSVVLLSIILIFRYFPHFNYFELKMAMRYLERKRLSTISIFISIFFGVSLMNLIPVLEQNINAELNGVDSKNSPEYFLFDIQEEQVEDLEIASKEMKFKLMSISPMIRSRLIKINGETVKVDKTKALTREKQRAQQFQNRGVNLSYRGHLNPGEEVIGGVFSRYDGVGEIPISLETRYMERIGVKLGDRLTFDILGLEFDGVIKSERQVKWTSFLPNFFILFPTGVLEDTPKTFLASVKMSQKTLLFMSEMSAKFPNVSIIDVKDITNKVSRVMSEMSTALTLMSVLSIVIGLVIITSLVGHQLIERKKDLTLYKMIGLKKLRIKRIIFIEFIGVTFFASSLGTIFGQLIGQIISYQMFYAFGDFDLMSVLKVKLLLFIFVFSIIGLITKKNI